MIKEKIKTVNIVINGKQVEQVDKFKYLGSVLTNDGRSLAAIKERIGMAKTAFNNRRELFIKKFDKDLKKKMVKCLVWPVALYGCETWTMKDVERDRLEAFEMWIWRRMEKISYQDRKTNEEVLTAAGEEEKFNGDSLEEKEELDWTCGERRGIDERSVGGRS